MGFPPPAATTPTDHPGATPPDQLLAVPPHCRARALGLPVGHQELRGAAALLRQGHDHLPGGVVGVTLAAAHGAPGHLHRWCFRRKK